jgi:hypothetical protein
MKNMRVLCKIKRVVAVVLEVVVDVTLVVVKLKVVVAVVLEVVVDVTLVVVKLNVVVTVTLVVEACVVVFVVMVVFAISQQFDSLIEVEAEFLITRP